jgi:hypothetical protein
MFHLKKETDFSILVLTKDRVMDNFQNCDSYIHIYCLLFTYLFSGIKEFYVHYDNVCM